MGVQRVVQGCFMGISSMFFSTFQGCLHVKRMVYEVFKSLSSVQVIFVDIFCFKGVSGLIKFCFKGYWRSFQEWFKAVLMMFTGCL